MDALHRAGVPLVIATSAPADDDIAARFSARLFQALEPGQETWATDVFDGYPYRTIPLQLDDDRLSAAGEYLKLLISTEELNTDMYNQKGLAAGGLLCD